MDAILRWREVVSYSLVVYGGELYRLTIFFSVLLHRNKQPGKSQVLDWTENVCKNILKNYQNGGRKRECSQRLDHYFVFQKPTRR